jgi:hypothetical protein
MVNRPSQSISMMAALALVACMPRAETMATLRTVFFIVFILNPPKHCGIVVVD